MTRRKLRRALQAAAFAMSIGALACGGPVSAALIVGATQNGMMELEARLVAENPALAELGAASPLLLRQALDMIAAALAAGSDTRGNLGSLDAEDARVLGRNPALMDVWRSSPEASADLLELIRTAAGGGKSPK